MVPVPAIFTRGRWECRDFKEVTSVESQILDFVEKQHALATVTPITVIPIPLSNAIDSVPIAQKNVIIPTSSTAINPASITTSTIYESGASFMDNAGISATVTSANIVAIDNKIEQAMVFFGFFFNIKKMHLRIKKKVKTNFFIKIFKLFSFLNF